MLETPSEILQHAASKDAADSFVMWRKMLKKPLTARAAGMVATSLREITGMGGDADEALDMAQERGWSTIKTAWYFRAKSEEALGANVIPMGAGHGNGNRNTQRHSATLRAIADAAREG